MGCTGQQVGLDGSPRRFRGETVVRQVTITDPEKFGIIQEAPPRIVDSPVVGKYVFLDKTQRAELTVGEDVYQIVWRTGVSYPDANEFEVCVDDGCAPVIVAIVCMSSEQAFSDKEMISLNKRYGSKFNAGEAVEIRRIIREYAPDFSTLHGEEVTSHYLLTEHGEK